MLELINLAYEQQTWQSWFGGSADRLRAWLAQSGCAGLEIIYGGTGRLARFPQDLTPGYHLMFYTDWLDFWRQDAKALTEKFGTPAVWQEFYQAADRDGLLAHFKADLRRAEQAGAKYVVFHVSDVSFAETYTYKWRHTDAEIIAAAAEFINAMLDGEDHQFDFLLENLPWPGLRFTDYKLTERLLENVHYPKKGLLLDFGHLMCTDLTLQTEADAARYIRRRLQEHGELCRYIKGVHLHRSLSGDFVRGFLHDPLPLPAGDVYQQFKQAYHHILQIDRHEPCQTGAMADVLAEIDPKYLVHELAAPGAAEKLAFVQQQRRALGLAR